jgi:ribosomal-protein-alanine N-acetyltransferase
LFDVCSIMRKPGLTELPVITTERLVLRALKKTDARQIVLLRSDERVTRYLGSAPKITTAEAAIFIKNIKDGVKTNEWFYWAVTPKSKDALIGTVCLWHIDKAKSQADTGYELHPDWQGQGLMREALTAVIAFGFNDLKLKQIAAITHQDNSRSLALLAALGFAEMENDGANQIFMSLSIPSIK